MLWIVPTKKDDAGTETWEMRPREAAEQPRARCGPTSVQHPTNSPLNDCCRRGKPSRDVRPWANHV